jgi:hypothetical protein
VRKVEPQKFLKKESEKKVENLFGFNGCPLYAQKFFLI